MDGSFCNTGCTDQCSFCNAVMCSNGTWTALEVFPAPCLDCDPLCDLMLAPMCELGPSDKETCTNFCQLGVDGPCHVEFADARACAEAVAQACAEAGGGRVLIATDSVFSMDGDLAPLAELIAVAERHGALLFLDEAHATGVLGGGRGALTELGLVGRVGAVMGTCSKALGSLGGFVCGSRVLCEHLRNHARGFIFDTSLPAPVVAATLAALDVIEREPERCARARALAVRLCRSLQALGYDAALPQAAIVPVLIGDSEAAVRLSARLRELGVLALAVRPPTVPAGTARLRLCTMATHTDEHIEQAVAAFAAARDSLSA